VKRMDREEMRVKINLVKLAGRLPDVVTVKELAAALGIDNKQAGKILARLERLGLYRRVSHSTYKRIA